MSSRRRGRRRWERWRRGSKAFLLERPKGGRGAAFLFYDVADDADADFLGVTIRRRAGGHCVGAFFRCVHKTPSYTAHLARRTSATGEVIVVQPLRNVAEQIVDTERIGLEAGHGR